MDNINLITQNDLCISCGACSHACPFNEIKIFMNENKGIYEPYIQQEATCNTCETKACLTVCPSYEENFIELANWTDPSQKIGPYYSIYTGYSLNSELRNKASSGGIIKEVCKYVMESGQVDGIITLAHIEGLEYEPIIYNSIDQIVNSPGSIYHNINFENAIEIIKTKKGKFVLIATPCQLTSVKKWQALYPEQSKAEIVFTIGLICGWMFTRYSLQHFSKATNVNFKDLQNVTYRGEGKYGDLVLTTKKDVNRFSRRPKLFTHPHASSYKIAFSRTYNSKRCLLCVEHLNYLADISVGDAWLDAFYNIKEGISILVIRNKNVDTILKEIEVSGRIKLAHASQEDVIASQSEDLALGLVAQKVINQMSVTGEFVPKYLRPIEITDRPSFSVWYKTYIFPAFFRYVTWNGFGYTLYKIRVLFYPLSYFFLFARSIITKIIKKIQKYIMPLLWRNSK